MRYGDFYFNPNAPNVIVPRTGTLSRIFYKGYQKLPVNSAIDWTNPLTKGLVICLLFNQPGSNTIVNLVRGDRAVTNVPLSPVPTYRGIGSGIDFRTGNRALLPFQPAYDLPNDFAGEIWAMPKTVSDAANHTCWGQAGGAGFSSRQWTIKFDYRSSGFWEGALYYPANNETLVTSATAAATDTLYHIVFTRKLGIANLYINGALQKTATLTNTLFSPNVGFYVASNNTIEAMNGVIFSARAWNRGLTSNEVSWLYKEPYSFIQPPLHKRYFFSAPNVAVATAAITGTAEPSATETEIVIGGETIIITLTNDTWVAAGAAFDAQRANIIQGLDSAQSELTGWNNEVRDKEVVGAVVRTSNTVVTITLSASAAYNITANETITVTVPATALTGNVAITATPTFDVTFVIAVGVGNDWPILTGNNFWSWRFS